MGGAIGGGFSDAPMGKVHGQGERFGNWTPWAEFNIYIDPVSPQIIYMYFDWMVLNDNTMIIGIRQCNLLQRDISEKNHSDPSRSHPSIPRHCRNSTRFTIRLRLQMLLLRLLLPLGLLLRLRLLRQLYPRHHHHHHSPQALQPNPHLLRQNLRRRIRSHTRSTGPRPSRGRGSAAAQFIFRKYDRYR